ncbi:MAG: hypothetical protein OXP73_07895 [Chloroflexota bacterium]|nr:hypothetical protein [Chloroflexota bacterium]
MKLRDVNTMDIGGAIRAGCRTMASVFNADDDDVPFFGSQVWPDPHLAFSSVHSESHVPGRHLNALLTAESLGFPIDEAAVEKHARAAFFSYGGPLALPLNRERIDGPLENFRPHNVREGFHALYALARFRDSERAREVAEASISTINRLWDPDRGWVEDRIARQHGVNFHHQGTFITGLGRAIGPLVKYYRATGYGPSLELAILLKEKAVADYFLADGSYDTERFGSHTHSTTCVMSSLAQLADLLNDAPLMARVYSFYSGGLWEIRDELGWVIESSAADAPPDRGEANNTGDILETALILGRWGYTEAYDDAERILRGHLLPSQLRDISWIEEPANPADEDGRRDVAKRHWGAFGFPAPYGHRPVGLPRVAFNMDIVGGAVASLCEAYREATRRDSAGHRVNLLFDHETAAVKAESPYTKERLAVTLKEPGPLFVRIPAWADPAGIQVTGLARPPLHADRYLLLSDPPVGRRLTFSLRLAAGELLLRHRTRDIRVRLLGDQVTAVENFGQDLTFFDPIL